MEHPATFPFRLEHDGRELHRVRMRLQKNGMKKAAYESIDQQYTLILDESDLRSHRHHATQTKEPVFQPINRFHFRNALISLTLWFFL